MRLRQVLFIILLGITSLPVLAQQSPEEALKAYRTVVGDHSMLYRGRLVTANQRTGWATHPFLDDEDFRPGTISFQGVVYYEVPMRYDIYNRELQILAKDSEFAMLLDQHAIDWFTYDDRHFVACQDGFAQQLYGGKYLRLEKQYRKKRANDVIYNNQVLFNVEQVSSLTVHLTTGDYPVKNLKSFQKLFPQLKQPLADFSRMKHLTFKGEERQTSLVALAQETDRLLTVGGAENVVAAAPLIAPVVMDTAKVRAEALEGVSMSASLPAYQVYREGSTQRPQYADVAQQTSGKTAGVSDLKPIKEEITLDEVLVTAFYSKVDNLSSGVEKFRPSMLRNMPMSMGESDVMKMVQTLPGVSSVGEASSGFNVRGGASDQNLILLGSNTVYNPMHMFGLFSAFNTDAIGEVELYKSSVPSQYGGRASSVMNMQNRPASKQQWNGSVSIGLLTSKAMLEMPLVKNKLSLMVAGRTTYSDWMLGIIPEESGYKDGKAGFYDLNALLSWNVNSRHVVNINAYHSHDRFSFTSDDKYAYDNTNVGMEWKGFWRKDLTSSVQAGYDHYDYLNDNNEFIYTASRLTFKIDQLYLKGLFTQTLNEKHTLKYGWDGTFYMVNPGKLQPNNPISSIAFDELERQKAFQGALFAEEEWRPSEKLRLTGGLRYNLFSSFQEGQEKTYHAPEVRLSASYFLPHHQSVKLGVGNLTQFIHKVSNTVIMSPTDTWTLSNAQIKPQRGWQFSGGYYWRTEDSHYEVSAEAYYKHLSSYPTYGTAAQLIMNHELHRDLIEAQGKAYGVELQLKKNSGRLTGWISYAFSRTFLRQNDDSATPINNGNWYPAEYDHPHELNLVSNFKFTERYSMSLNMDYSTGRPTTVPAGKYWDFQREQYLPYYTDRNSYRLPDNFRMDVSFNFAPSHHKTNKFHCWFSIGCYNVTAHRNVYSLYYKQHMGNIQGYKLSIFGAPIPYIAFNFKF